MLPVETPFKTYTGIDGKPLNGGYVYFGLPNQNPITAPVEVYWDAAGTQPAAQPLRTVNGYIMRAGTPANVFYDGAYSELVQDSKWRHVYFARDSSEFSFGSILAASSGASLIGLTQGVGALTSTVQTQLRRTVWVDDFGTDKAAFDAALAFVGNYGEINLRPGATYTLASTWVFPTTSIGVIVRGHGATILASHNGDGVNITAQNENYGGHKFYDLTIKGPNVSYPASLAELNGTSTGAGLMVDSGNTNAASAYKSEFYNCHFMNFKKGMSLQAALWCKFFGGSARFNQYGVYIDGGQTNANNWYGFLVRENRVRGFYSNGNSSGSLSLATANVFHGGGFETNIPYRGDNPAGFAGGYPIAMDTTGAVGVAVFLTNSYDFIFRDTYFENHNYSTWLNGSSDNNSFSYCRFAPGGNRIGGVALDTGGTSFNTYDNCTMIGSSTTVANVEMLAANQFNNQFLDCQGFTFIAANLVSKPYVRNNRTNQAGGGTKMGAITMPSQGYVQNPGEGTTPGTITGIATGAAALNAYGIGEVELSTQITGDTTITSIAGMVPGQFLTLRNYQIAHNVTIASSLFDYGDLILKNNRSVVLSKYGQELILYCNGQGKVYEHGRNFSDMLCGEVNIADAATSATITFANAEKDALYYPVVSAGAITAGAPAAGAYTVHISNKTAAGFNIILSAAPGAGNALNFEWLAAR